MVALPQEEEVWRGNKSFRAGNLNAYILHKMRVIRDRKFAQRLTHSLT